MTNWHTYYDQVGSTPNALVQQVVKDYVQNREVALDLGAGNLRDSIFLLESGFKRVISIDRETPKLIPPMIEFRNEDISGYRATPNLLNLAVSCNTLFFLPHKTVIDLLKRVEVSLQAGGVCACNLLGEKDEWLKRGVPDAHGFPDVEAQALCHTFNTLILTNNRYEGVDAKGNPKFWDLWTLVFRK